MCIYQIKFPKKKIKTVKVWQLGTRVHICETDNGLWTILFLFYSFLN